MLFVTIPKSASSSIIDTISIIHKIDDNTSYFRNKNFSDLDSVKEYLSLKKTHSEMLELNSEVIEKIKENKDIQKHHFPPTFNNQKLLKEIPKVILLRDPKDIILSYKRGDESGVFKVKDPNFAFCFSEKQWLKKAKDNGVLKNLQDFYDGWINHDGNKLVIYYDELISDSEKVVKKIENYFNLESSNEKVELSKKRYSRSRKINIKRIPKMLWNRRSVIKQRLGF
jgi:hypothetical protein